MYNLKVEMNFSAAHNLRGYRGKCEALHGHNWKVEACLSGKALDKCGMLADFSGVKRHLGAVLEELDHCYLNEHGYFKRINPTSENIAKYIFARLKPRVKQLCCVTVWESENSAATYYASALPGFNPRNSGGRIKGRAG